MRTKFLSLIAGIMFASILSGCGGSSSSGQSVSTGVYKDAGIVSGLQYKTATQSGVTDSNGSFKYVAGETVTFSVSNVTIGQTTGAPIVTTFDLVGIAPPTSSFGIPTNNPTSKKFQEVINISLFLQTLDDDSDPTNGIAIPAVVNSVVAANPLDFKLFNRYDIFQLWYGFRDSPQFKVFIGSCRTAGAWGGTKAIKQTGYAANSLYKGLDITPSVYLANRETYNEGGYTSYEYTNSGLKHKELYYDNSNSLVYLTTYTYNQNGDNTSRVEFDVSANTTTTNTFVYDANGSRIGWTVGTGRLVSEYDINGNMTKNTFFDNGNLRDYVVRSFNANGTLATEKAYDANNVLIYSHTYTYNSNLLVASLTYTYGSNQSATVVQYDKNNNVSKVTTTNSYDSDVLVDDYTYDIFGNITAIVHYNNGVQYNKNVFTWDSNGYLVTTKDYGANDQLLNSIVATYDINGSRTSLTSNYDNTTSTTTYTYIGQSNWGDLLEAYSAWFPGPV